MNKVNDFLERNYTRGRKDKYGVVHQPIAIVFHITDVTASAKNIRDSFNRYQEDPGRRASSHYVIDRDGTVYYIVEEENTAYHTGVVDRPTWGRLKKHSSGAIINPNAYTIGMEFCGNWSKLSEDYTEAQYASAIELCDAISNRWSLPLNRDHFVLHREIRKNKTCPGMKADINRIIAGIILRRNPVQNSEPVQPAPEVSLQEIDRLKNEVNNRDALIRDLNTAIASKDELIRVKDVRIAELEDQNLILQADVKTMTDQRLEDASTLKSVRDVSDGKTKTISELQAKVIEYKAKYEGLVNSKSIFHHLGSLLQGKAKVAKDELTNDTKEVS